SGVPVSVNESYNFTLGGVAQGNFNIHTSMNELSVIVWVQVMTSKEILQSVVAYFAVSTEVIPSQLVQAKLLPNPINDLYTLRINLEESADLSIDVINSVGAKVYTASKGTMSAGETSHQIDASTWASGIYMVHITANGLTTTKKMTVE